MITCELLFNSNRTKACKYVHTYKYVNVGKYVCMQIFLIHKTLQHNLTYTNKTIADVRTYICMHACGYVCIYVSGLLGLYTAFNGSTPYCECFVIRSRTTSVLAASAVDTLGHPPLDDDSVSSTVDTQSIHLCTLHALRESLRANSEWERVTGRDHANVCAATYSN